METDQLRTFTTVARTGSFTATARELGYVQSTITAHLKALERRFGVRLLDRLPTGARLTEAGERLLRYAAQVLDLEARITEDVPAKGGSPTGHVRILAPESLCAYRLPALITGLRAVAPAIRLTLAPADTTRALRAVREGTTEAALILEPKLNAAGLRLTPLGLEPLVLLGAPTLGLTDRPLTWQELAAYDVLLLEDGCSYSDEVVQRLLALGQPDTRRARFGSIETVKRCVAAGLGWTVLPTVTADTELREGSLTAIQAAAPPSPTVNLISHPDRTLSGAAEYMLAHLAASWPASS